MANSLRCISDGLVEDYEIGTHIQNFTGLNMFKIS